MRPARQFHPEIGIGLSTPDDAAVAGRVWNQGRHHFGGLHRHGPGVDQVHLIAATVRRQTRSPFVWLVLAEVDVADPAVALFVISGGMAKAGDLLLDRLRDGHERFALPKSANLPPEPRPRFVVGHFLANDTLMGAAGLVLREHGRVK